MALQLPLGFRHSATVIDDAGEDEEQVGQAIHVAQQHRIDRRIERDHPALGAAADRPRHVERGAGRRAARENEPAKTIADISGGRGLTEDPLSDTSPRVAPDLLQPSRQIVAVDDRATIGVFRQRPQRVLRRGQVLRIALTADPFVIAADRLVCSRSQGFSATILPSFQT